MRIFLQKYIVERRNDLNSKIHEHIFTNTKKPLNIIGGENTEITNMKKNIIAILKGLKFVQKRINLSAESVTSRFCDLIVSNSTNGANRKKPRDLRTLESCV